MAVERPIVLNPTQVEDPLLVEDFESLGYEIWVRDYTRGERFQLFAERLQQHPLQEIGRLLHNVYHIPERIHPLRILKFGFFPH